MLRQDELPASADVVVVGGGINGTSLAFHLARARAGSVVVLERAVLAAGATGKSGGIVRCHYPNPLEARLALWSLRYFRCWDDLVGGDCGFRTTGLVVITPGRDREKLARNVTWQRDLGIDACAISHEDLHALDPDVLVPEDAGLAFESGAGYADPNAANGAFARGARQLGARFCLDVQARRVLIRGERVTGVRTSRGTIRTNTVVVAAGAQANTLLAPLGLDLGLSPTLSRVSLFRDAPERSLRHPVYLDHLAGSWCRPAAEGCTLFGSERTVRHGVRPGVEAEGVSARVVREHRRALGARFPVMKKAINRGGWSGLFMNSRDALPLVGPLPYEGLYAIAGDSGSGFKIAPALGAGLSEWIVQGAPISVDLLPLHPERALRPKAADLSTDTYSGPRPATISR
jgi:sarcosine oxidase subunit beta